ncbi:MAG: 2-succinyl-5-enolpyruvyl-6-hydroxy-3-cyclohexene-1-carboxylic-acid synthase [Verrucomicrobiota bacterium]
MLDKSNSSPFDSLARSNLNSAWGALTIEVLARLGLEKIVISPGSRSTPLTIAAARNAKIEAIPVLDERSAAFFALGLAKRTHKPVALICTSGSAAANYFPAVVEASMSGTPLLLLTADRPPELRDCASGQTIDQTKLYGNYVRLFAELTLPEVEPSILAFLRQTLVHAVARSLDGNPGPVHLNFPFRDPLAPELDVDPVIAVEALETAATVVTRPCESEKTSGSFDTVALERLGSHQHGLIVVGDINPNDSDAAFTEAIKLISDKLGWPVLSDVLNPLRGQNFDSLIINYDSFLRVPAKTKDLKPTAILQIGPLPTSKVLRQWLAVVDPVSFLLSERPMNTDPLHRVAAPLLGKASALAECLPNMKNDPAWLELWDQTERETDQLIRESLESTEDLFEGKASFLLSKHLPEKSAVFLASSMSVRYAEWFWRAGDRAHSIYSNRGANGIDGTLGTALGVAHGGQPTVLLTGDLAFLHDSNALLIQPKLRGSLTVILINNIGGGIFEHLPVAENASTFEEFFATPQAVDLEALCSAHSILYDRIQDWDTFTNQIGSLPEQGVRVLEIRTDRKSDVRTLADIRAALIYDSVKQD